MPTGFQIFDTAGNVELDTTMRAGRVLGVLLNQPTSGSITDDRLLDGTPWAVAFLGMPNTSSLFSAVAGSIDNSFNRFTFSGSSMSWNLTKQLSNGSSSAAPLRIIYGVH